ncbi:hypothetical protein [Synechococcus sp. MIT S9509]|uniref:hypothetical protein n=1 Tax=unclassified Synechococcus TaxID=2626047 RepID=UPI0039B0D3E0
MLPLWLGLLAWLMAGVQIFNLTFLASSFGSCWELKLISKQFVLFVWMKPL